MSAQSGKARAAERTARGHVHGEAFCLMTYACNGKPLPDITARNGSRHLRRSQGCGHSEVFWNSRDGVTPFGATCPVCGGNLQHLHWHNDVYAPGHTPTQGQGVWRDGTADEAEQFMRQRIEQCKGTQHEVGPEFAERLIAIARSGDPEQCPEFQKGWPILERVGGSVNPLLAMATEHTNPTTRQRHGKWRQLPKRSLEDVVQRIGQREAKRARRAEQARRAGLLP